MKTNSLFAVQCIHSFKCWLCQCNLLQQRLKTLIIAPVQFLMCLLTSNKEKEIIFGCLNHEERTIQHFGFDPTQSNSSSLSSLRFIVFHDQSLESDILSSKIDTVMTRNFTCTTKVNRCIKLNKTSDSRQFILNNRACN